MHLTNTKPFLQTNDKKQEPQTLLRQGASDNHAEMNESKLKWAKLTLTTPRTDLSSNSTIFITGADFKIGRAPTNDFVLSDQRLSSLHARITYEFDDQSQMIVKLWDNSTNGTFHMRKEVIDSDRDNLL